MSRILVFGEFLILTKVQDKYVAAYILELLQQHASWTYDNDSSSRKVHALGQTVVIKTNIRPHCFYDNLLFFG